MRRLTFATLLACLAMLASCVPLPPPAPFSGQYSGDNETAYRRGYHLGFQDGKRGWDADHERHHREYNSQTVAAFEHGYSLGFETGEDRSEADDTERLRAKDDGYNAGRTDAQNGLSPFHQRHRRNYTNATEPDFRDGYVRGYNSVRGGDASPGAPGAAR